MKKLIVIVVVLLSIGITNAQEINKDTYVLHGDVIEANLYHDNGTIAQTGFYTKDNKLQGEWISYDINGVKTAVANYSNGKKVGVWKFFNGDEMKEVMYKNSKIVEVKTWAVKSTRVVSN
jgi:antitoxin component YwqK of YwqJK toxin-antitoxin module